MSVYTVSFDESGSNVPNSVMVNGLSPFVYVRPLEEEKAMNPGSYLEQKPQLIMAVDHTPTRIRLPNGANRRHYFYYRKPNGGAHIKTAFLISPDRWIGWIGSESVPAGRYNDTGALQRRPVPYEERTVEMQLQLAVLPQSQSALSELQCMIDAVKEAGCDARIFADGGYTFKMEELAASGADHYLVTPVRKYKARGLTPQQVKFNEKLQAIRSPIEKVFGGLKAAWAVIAAAPGSDAQFVNDMLMIISATANIQALAVKTTRLSSPESDHTTFASGQGFFRPSLPDDDLSSASDAAEDLGLTPEFIRQLPDEDMLAEMYKIKADKGPVLAQPAHIVRLRSALGSAGCGRAGRCKQLVEATTAEKRKQQAAKEEETALRLARRMLKRAKREEAATQPKKRCVTTESRLIGGIAAGATTPPPRSRGPPSRLKDYDLNGGE